MQAHWLDRQLLPLDAAALRAEGILLDHVPVRRYQASLDALKKERGYLQQDELALFPEHPDLEDLCDKLGSEHRHGDDEVRYVLEGEGIFDIRSLDERWMRVKLEIGDLIVVPDGRFHRFFLTESLTFRSVRLYSKAAGCVPSYRGAQHRVSSYLRA